MRRLIPSLLKSKPKSKAPHPYSEQTLAAARLKLAKRHVDSYSKKFDFIKQAMANNGESVKHEFIKTGDGSTIFTLTHKKEDGTLPEHTRSVVWYPENTVRAFDKKSGEKSPTYDERYEHENIEQARISFEREIDRLFSRVNQHILDNSVLPNSPPDKTKAKKRKGSGPDRRTQMSIFARKKMVHIPDGSGK